MPDEVNSLSINTRVNVEPVLSGTTQMSDATQQATDKMKQAFDQTNVAAQNMAEGVQNSFSQVTDSASQASDQVTNAVGRFKNTAQEAEEASGALAAGLEIVSEAAGFGAVLAFTALAFQLGETYRQYDSIDVVLDTLNPKLDEQSQKIENIYEATAKFNREIEAFGNKEKLANLNAAAATVEYANEQVKLLGIQQRVAAVTADIEQTKSEALDKARSAAVAHGVAFTQEMQEEVIKQEEYDNEHLQNAEKLRAQLERDAQESSARIAQLKSAADLAQLNSAKAVSDQRIKDENELAKQLEANLQASLRANAMKEAAAAREKVRIKEEQDAMQARDAGMQHVIDQEQKAALKREESAQRYNEEQIRGAQEERKIQGQNQEAAIKAQQELGIISKQKALEETKKVHAQEIADELHFINELIAIYKNDPRHPEKVAQLESQARQIQLRGERIQLQDETAIINQKRAHWNQYFNTLNSSMSTAIKGWIQFGGDLRESMERALVGVLADEAQFAVAWLEKKAELWLMDEILGKATQTSQALGQITSNAAVAYSGAYAATAAIPIIGPELAPGVAAAAMSAVLAITPMAAFDKGSGYIPRSGIAMLHEGESVLPPPQTQALKDLMDNGGKKVVINNHTTLNAMGDQHFKGMLNKHADYVAGRVMQSLRRQNII